MQSRLLTITPCMSFKHELTFEFVVSFRYGVEIRGKCFNGRSVDQAMFVDHFASYFFYSSFQFTEEQKEQQIRPKIRLPFLVPAASYWRWKSLFYIILLVPIFLKKRDPVRQFQNEMVNVSIKKLTCVYTFCILVIYTFRPTSMYCPIHQPTASNQRLIAHVKDSLVTRLIIDIDNDIVVSYNEASC